MASQYSLPPQLEQTPDFAGKFLSGVQIGAAIGEAKNKLAQSQQQFAVEAQQKSDQITASALKEAQELAVSKAYNDQQISLKQQQLQIADQKVGQETLKAARQYQAQQQYQTDFKSLVDGGMSEDDAAKSAMFKNLGMFGTGAGSGAAAMRAVNQKKATAPKFMTDPVSGQRVAYNEQSGHFMPIKAPASVQDAASFQASPLTDTSGKALPGKYTVPGPGGTRRVITTSAKNQNADAIKALEGGKYGIFLQNGTEPKTLPKDKMVEWQQVKQQYNSLKSGVSAPTAEPAAASPTTAATGAADERVSVTSPDGATGTMLKSKWDKFSEDLIDEGWEKVNE